MTKRRKLRRVNPGTTVQSTTVRATGDVAGIMMTGRGTITGCITGGTTGCCITGAAGGQQPLDAVMKKEADAFGSAGRFAAIVGQLRPATGHHDRRAGLQ
jgi:hypothetical protein